MPKFRKKPVVIEAEQFFYDAPGAGLLRLKYGLVQDMSRDHSEKVCFIQTLEGRMAVSDGDWIITGVNGERYPCKPDIFAKTYEAVE